MVQWLIFWLSLQGAPQVRFLFRELRFPHAVQHGQKVKKKKKKKERKKERNLKISQRNPNF